MKVLAAVIDWKNLDPGPISLNVPFDYELAVLEHCEDCDPDDEHFRGVESGELTPVAVVIERPDITEEILVEIFIQHFLRSMHVEGLSLDVVTGSMRQEVRNISQVLHRYSSGDTIHRHHLTANRQKRRRKKAS